MKWIKSKKLLTTAMLALVTVSVVGCYAPYRRYSHYDHHRRDEYRRSDYRRSDRHDRHRDYHRWNHDQKKARGERQKKA